MAPFSSHPWTLYVNEPRRHGARLYSKAPWHVQHADAADQANPILQLYKPMCTSPQDDRGPNLEPHTRIANITTIAIDHGPANRRNPDKNLNQEEKPPVGTIVRTMHANPELNAHCGGGGGSSYSLIRRSMDPL